MADWADELLSTVVPQYLSADTLDEAERVLLAALREVRATALEEAAKVAEGPPIETNNKTGEVSMRGRLNGGNWSVPQPLAGYRGSDYGTGRYDAAAAIRALVGPTT